MRFIAASSPLTPPLKTRVEAAFGQPLHNGYRVTECVLVGKVLKNVLKPRAQQRVPPPRAPPKATPKPQRKPSP